MIPITFPIFAEKQVKSYNIISFDNNNNNNNYNNNNNNNNNIIKKCYIVHRFLVLYKK